MQQVTAWMEKAEKVKKVLASQETASVERESCETSEEKQSCKLQ